jgi:hypothetical protein
MHVQPARSSTVLYMVIEHFKNRDPSPVYQRFRAVGRMAPPELQYVASWVTSDLCHCYQVMECSDRGPLDEWIAKWSDIVDFEVIPVLTSEQAARKVS